jgi:prepilin-type N-terminal cleavage/methylation domain-containing protein
MAPRYQISSSANDAMRRAAAIDGFTMIELLAAMLILAVGILSTFRVFDSSNRATSVAEAQQNEIHRAQREIERLQSLPYQSLFLTSTPATSANPNNPGSYVKVPPGNCASEYSAAPTFQWNQAAGGASSAEKLVIKNCSYQFEESSGVGTELKTELLTAAPNAEGACPGLAGVAACGEGVAPEASWQDERVNSLNGTVYDYITWVKDPNCSPGKGCPSVNDYKRITVEVTNNTKNPAIAPTAPVLVSAIVVNPRALPLKGQPKSENPLETTEIKCTNGQNEIVKCTYGLGSETANTWNLTNSPEETGYTEPTSNNACMHYTDALDPWPRCGATAPERKNCELATTTYTTCPQLDLLSTARPTQSLPELNFSPNLSATTAGRVLAKDPLATSCSASSPPPPQQNAAMGQWWATSPVTEKLKLSGNGAMTLYTRTLGATSAAVTLCVGVYLENPVVDSTCKAVLGPEHKPILDPLNFLNSSCASTSARKDSELLGVVSVTKEAWPTEITPVSFGFSYMPTARELPVNSSIAVRVWPTAASADIVLQYDVLSALSTVQFNSE